MQRNFRAFLTRWKNHSLRMPLIVRGARQVGKTYLIQSFGEKEFDNVVAINFELSPKFQTPFDSMEPHTILSQLEIISRQRIIPGKTLLFLDEIQQCPNALQSLRYFKEQLPDLHLIAAGSLLEFAIKDEEFSFPVGRVQFARMYPLSFEEFLVARGDIQLQEKLSEFNEKSPPPPAIHAYLLDRLKEYFIVGGMPAAVQAYQNTLSLLEAKYVQKSLWDAFENDFGKYAKMTQHKHLRKIFTEVPRLIGDHVKYSRIDPESPNPAREIKAAIELLKLAGLLHPLYSTQATSAPLMASLKETVFKLIFLDIGMVEQAMNIDPSDPGLMKGALAEQFVGQELLATSDPVLDFRLFFWNKDKGMAEVDYLFPHKNRVFPVEVKAGKSGILKSLHQYVEHSKVPFGIKISLEPLGWNRGVLTVPFYLTSHLSRLIDDKLKQ